MIKVIKTINVILYSHVAEISKKAKQTKYFMVVSVEATGIYYFKCDKYHYIRRFYTLTNYV